MILFYDFVSLTRRSEANKVLLVVTIPDQSPIAQELVQGKKHKDEWGKASDREIYKFEAVDTIRFEFIELSTISGRYSACSATTLTLTRSEPLSVSP